MFKVCVSPLKRLSIKAFAASLSLTTALTPVMAAPTGGQITQGQGVISQSGHATSIVQNTDKLVVEWQSFDAINGETVTFLQPNSGSWALNRVLSGQATSFNGSLFANGKIIIINGSGIHFGPNSHVDVGSLIASTSDTSDTNFLAGKFIFDRKGNPEAMISNAGTITVQESGLAALVAPGVENKGYIQADLGTVILGAGEAHTLDFYGDGLIKFAITAPTSKTPKRNDGSEADALITNSGNITADGGSIIMSASQASSVLSSAINMSGVAQARSVSKRGGKIILGGGGGKVRVSGKVDTSAKIKVSSPDYIPSRGGDIHIVGKKIEIAETANIDASGDNGGGNVLIGGAFQGGNLNSDSEIGYQVSVDTSAILVGSNASQISNGFIQEAENVDVERGAKIEVSAIKTGDAGTAIIWSNNTTDFAASIYAKGGAQWGNGGLVEVSGKSLAYNGFTDTTAANGEMGWLMLDPVGINVIDGDFDPNIQNAADPVLEITDGTINAYLAWSNVLLATSPSQADIYADGEVPLDEHNASDNDDRIVIADGTHIEAETFGGEFEVDPGTLYLSTGTLDLYSTINANVSGGASSPITRPGITLRDPHTVNVFDGDHTKGSINQALELVADQGKIGVGEGTFDKFTVSRDGITITGQGANSIVQAGSPAVTVAANNITVQNLTLTGTNTVGEIGVLLDGTASPNLTGINIVNVDMQDLDEGVVSQGDIGDGNNATIDVSIRGNSATDRAELSDFLEDAIDLDDTDGDANYEIKHLEITDAGDDGIQLGGLNSATIQGNLVFDVDEDALVFTDKLTNASVLIGGDTVEEANVLAGFERGIAVDELEDGTFAIKGNFAIGGGIDGIHFEETIKNASVEIKKNLGIGGFFDGIYFEGSLDNANVEIVENTAIGGGDDGMNIEKIKGGSFTVSQNELIFGDQGSGIEFDDDISDNAKILVSENREIIGEEEGIEFDTTVESASVEIKKNRLIEGKFSDGIQFNETVTDSSIQIADNLDIKGGSNGIAFFSSTSKALAGNTHVEIDRNGAQTQNGDTYNGSDPAELANLTIVGKVHGVEGSGIAFYDTIADDARVTISRNVIADNYIGIEFGEIASSAFQKIHNNFVGNGSLAGIGFLGDVSSAVEIFQNYIITNGQDGIRVFTPSYYQNAGSGPNIGTNNILVHQNYIPGPKDTFKNGQFAINNEGTGDMDVEGNWFGSADAADVATALNGITAPTSYLETGTDTNIEDDLGKTDFDPFAFQSGEVHSTAGTGNHLAWHLTAKAGSGDQHSSTCRSLCASNRYLDHFARRHLCTRL